MLRASGGVFAICGAELLIGVGHRKSYFVGGLAGAIGSLLLIPRDGMKTLFFVGLALRGMSQTVLAMANRMWLLETYRPEEQLVGQAIFQTVTFAACTFMDITYYPFYFWFGYTNFCICHFASFLAAMACVYATKERFPRQLNYTALEEPLTNRAT